MNSVSRLLPLTLAVEFSRREMSYDNTADTWFDKCLVQINFCSFLQPLRLQELLISLRTIIKPFDFDQETWKLSKCLDVFQVH